jgi:hypothetical protein
MAEAGIAYYITFGRIGNKRPFVRQNTPLRTIRKLILTACFVRVVGGLMLLD